jgi:hypothetical protein
VGNQYGFLKGVATKDAIYFIQNQLMWINNWTKQTSGDVAAALSMKDGPMRMVKQ